MGRMPLAFLVLAATSTLSVLLLCIVVWVSKA